MTGEGALKELVAKGGYIGRAGNIAPLDVDALALPPDGCTPGPLAELEAMCSRKLVEGLINMVLPDDEAAKKRNHSGIRRIIRALCYDAPAVISLCYGVCNSPASCNLPPAAGAERACSPINRRTTRSELS